MNEKQPFAPPVGADQSRLFHPTGAGFSLEGIEPMNANEHADSEDQGRSKVATVRNPLAALEPDENTTEGRRELTERTLCKMIGELSKGGDALGAELVVSTAHTLARSMCDFQREIEREDKYASVIRNLEISNANTKRVTSVIESTSANVQWLRSERERRIAVNKNIGKDNQANGNAEANKRAAKDMELALKRVHGNAAVRAGKHGALMNECRHVCRKFSAAGRKNELGVFDDYLPLTGADGEAIKPETLAKNYRKRYGKIKKRKANAAKNRARTQAARDAKTRRTK